MKGVSLTFYCQELRKHKNTVLYECFLSVAKSMGIAGGSVFKGIASFGRHKVLHKEHFFELASNVPVQVLFIVSEDEAKKIIKLV